MAGVLAYPEDALQYAEDSEGQTTSPRAS
jgi:hypothetical protein